MKKIVLAICIAIIMSVSVFAASTVKFSASGFDKVYPSYSETVVVENDGLIGVVDRNGNTVVPFGNYSVTLPDSLGRVVVYENGNSTVYDKNGKVIAEYENICVISVADGIVVGLHDGKYVEGGILLYSVTYSYLDTGKVIYQADNVIDATPFSDGYASVCKNDYTTIINLQGEEVFYDTTPLMPIGCPAGGIATFEAFDENGDVSYYIVDLKNQKRICMAGLDEFENDTNFTETWGRIKNVAGFYGFVDNDNRTVPVLDGIFAPIIEDPEYFYTECLIIRDGVEKALVDNITTFVSGEKYLFYDRYGITSYYTVDGEKVTNGVEGLTAFADGMAIIFDLDNFKYVFINDDFQKISENFSGFFSVHLFGDLFCGFDEDKYYFIINDDGQDTSIPSAPDVPSAPSAPSKPDTPLYESGMKNFVKTATYSSSVFPDVKEKDWFVKNVALAYETGLMNGKGDGFAPLDNLTVAQVITMAARLNSIYETGKAEFVQGSVWYQVYVDYCVEKGIIAQNDFDNYNRNTTRAEFVRILSCAIPEKEFEIKNSVSGVPDVNSADKDYKAILMFYRAGILSGSDSAHNFKPTSEITRAETAAIITRIIDKTLRVSFEIK